MTTVVENARRPRLPVEVDQAPAHPAVESAVDPVPDLVAPFTAEDCPADAELDAITRVAATLTGTPFAMVQISLTGWMHLIATHGFPRAVVPRAGSLCDRARELTDGVFASTDLAADPAFAGSPWIDGRMAATRGYASAPLIADGALIGALCVSDLEPHPFTAEQSDRLADLAVVVVALLERRRQARREAELAAASEAARSALEGIHARLATVHADLADAQAFDRALLDALPVGVLACDAGGHVRLFNRLGRDWHGGDVEVDDSGVPTALTLLHDDGVTPLQREEVPHLRVLAEGSISDVAVVVAIEGVPPRHLSVSGQTVTAADGTTLGAVLAMADVTRQRQLETELRVAALHDPLTGLPNRTLLIDRVERMLALGRRSGNGSMAVLFCDLDGFKAINDEHGHAAGDEVLVRTAGRLSAAVRPGDTVARLGGDEFVVLCPGVEGFERAGEIGARLAAAVSRPLDVGAVSVQVGVSIGLVLAEPGDDPDSLLTRADDAMYGVKRAHHRQR